MGICLDTEQSNGSQLFDEQNSRAGWNDERRFISTPPDGQFPMHNGGTVQFESPRVPVIFVLGGPGSGKVTHCDNLMQEKRGIVHINMTDLLQQYAIGNDMQDFSQLSSKTVTEVLMLEMKMAPNAKTYLVSGYPRNMRDVVEYSDKIQVVNGAVMISWRQKILERQIDYGAKLGQVVLSLARMELNNFYKNVMPVAEYFDQSGMLIAVNGERHPGEVYKDFRSSIMKILGTQNNPPALTNGRAAVITDEPDLVAPQKVPQQAPLAVRRAAPPLQPIPMNTPPPQDVITVRAHDTTSFSPPTKPGWPSVIWVIGGPGSNKAVLCSQSVRNIPGWVHISVGKLLRDSAEPIAARPDTKIIRQCITAGDMVPPNIVMQLLETHLGANMSTPGVVLDGYPRDLKQINEFEVKFKQKPHLVLLDCSKLQLGRGRLDDSVSAFRRRLELFRELTLPMLKSLDSEGRLTIVDGDTDSSQVQEEFNKVIRQLTKEQQDQTTNPNNEYLQRRRGTIVEDLDAITGLETISKRVSEQSTSMGNGISNGIKGKMMANGGLPKQSSYDNNITGNVPNGIANGGPLKNKVADMYTSLANQRRENIKNMYNDGNNYF